MIITALLENETVSSQYEKKHGLSLYVKTQEHNILFDLGPDETFIKNAEKMNIDLKEVNIVVISHGHNDHGGGLKAFLEYNDKAKIYIRKSAFNPHYTTPLLWTKINIGLDNELMDNERIIFTDALSRDSNSKDQIGPRLTGNASPPPGSSLINQRLRF